MIEKLVPVLNPPAPPPPDPPGAPGLLPPPPATTTYSTLNVGGALDTTKESGDVKT